MFCCDLRAIITMIFRSLVVLTDLSQQPTSNRQACAKMLYTLPLVVCSFPRSHWGTNLWPAPCTNPTPACTWNNVIIKVLRSLVGFSSTSLRVRVLDIWTLLQNSEISHKQSAVLKIQCTFPTTLFKRQICDPAGTTQPCCQLVLENWFVIMCNLLALQFVVGAASWGTFEVDWLMLLLLLRKK